MSDTTGAPALHQSVFRTIFQAYPDGMIVVDSGGRIVMANPSAESMLGYGPGELLGLGVETLVPDSIRPRHEAYRAEYAENPRPRPMGTQMDLVARRRDGSEVTVEIALSPLQNLGWPYIVAAIRNVGGYPRVRQALKRARYAECVAEVGRLAVDMRDLQPLLERLPRVAAQALEVDRVLVFLLEPNRLEFRIASGSGLVGSEKAGASIAAHPRGWPGFVLSANAPVIIADWREERRFAAPPALQAAGVCASLGVPMSDRGRIIGVITAGSPQPLRFGEDDVHFLVSLANLLVASLQRMQSEEALAHSQRLESVGQLTGGIAHDFNNLLTVIQGNLQILEEHPGIADDAWGQQLVGAATRAARRGAELTGKLLAFSRRQVLQPSAVDVNALLESLADMLRRTLDQRIEITLDTQPDLPPCVVDPGQLESALLNIAINARDAMPEGGRLTFSSRRCEGAPPAAEVESTEGDFIRIAVADTGSGMPEDVRERAFEPFFTTKEAGRGTGLGLSTVYGFVKQSHGGVTLETAPGVGTTVTLYVPVHAPGTTVVEAEPAVDRRVPPGLRVLLVEDEPEVRDVTAAFLAALGCEVTPCPDAEQALAVLTESSDFDLLLTDIALGAGMRGSELARRAEIHSPQLAVLLMSGYAAEDLGDAQQAPWELLRKPFTRRELAQAVARAVANA